jgi:hypothetical protein
MHPSEMKDRAFAAAAKAERDGFTATAAALMLLASTCAAEARDLENKRTERPNRSKTRSTFERICTLEVIH